MKQIIVIIFCMNIILSSYAYAANARELFDRGNQHFKRGEYYEAIDVYEQVVKQDPNFAPVFNQLGLAYKEIGVDLKEVVWYFRAAIDINPDFGEAYANLGKTYYEIGDFDKAEFACKKALTLNPGLLSAGYSLGWIYLLGKKQPADAIKYFRTVADQTKLPDVYYALGAAYLMKGDRVQVIEIITQLRALGKDVLAMQLEDLLRGGRYLPMDFGMPPGSPQPVSSSTRQKGTLVSSGGETAVEEPPEAPSQRDVGGVTRIQLRGRLFGMPKEE